MINRNWLSLGITIGVMVCASKVITFPASPSSTATELSGQSVIGTELTSYDEQGQAKVLKIFAANLDPKDPDQELYLYTVAYRNTSGKWQNLCSSNLITSHSAAQDTQAISLSGHWDETGAHVADSSITFACADGVLAKCVRWGYKPWKVVDGISLRGYHQACTRMARADYCGNGMSHTQDGTPIEVSDRLNIQRFPEQSQPLFKMELEATWNSDGAVSLHHTRWSNTLRKLQKDCPKKLEHMLESQSSPYNSSKIQNGDAIIANRSTQP